MNEQQPSIEIIFCGKGNRIMVQDKEAYDNVVRIYVQNKAWSDQVFYKEWYETHLLEISDENHPEEYVTGIQRYN